jgi:hypothetical protein
MTDPDVRAALIAGGWRRGSVLPGVLVDAVRWSDGEVAPPAGARVVLVSHDCDIVSRDPNDSMVLDVIAAESVSKPDPNNQFAKNPRRLVVRAVAAGGDSELIQLERRWKGSIRSEHLVSYAGAHARVVGDELKQLTGWLVRSISRSAFPDEFNDRLKKGKPFSRIRDIARRIDRQPLGIFVHLGDQMEKDLKPDEVYEIDVRVVMDGEMLPGDDAWEAFEQTVYNPLITQIKRIEGIRISTEQLLTDAMMSYRQRRHMYPLDLDDLSLRDDSAGATPHDV